MLTHFERKLMARDKGLCPDCGATLEKCEPVEVHENYQEVPRGWTWARRCPAEGCGFGFVSMGPDFRMTRAKDEEDGHMNISMEMPKYKCHKVVHALKIKEVEMPLTLTAETAGTRTLVFEDERYTPLHVSAKYADKHNPQPGGYYIVYGDGYKSFSPAKAFEDGYTLIS